MTSSKADDLLRRRAGRPRRNKQSLIESFRENLLYELEISTRVRFPSPLYQKDPVRFFHEILGVEPWERAIELIEAARDHLRVACIAGQKVAKSHSLAGIALWKYCSWADARVIMTSTTARQVDEVLWRELRMMRARSGRCVACKKADPEGFKIPKPCPHSSIIEGDEGMLARTGLRAQDFREVVGFTAREAEAVAGISGSQLTYIVDEASGVPEVIFEAIEGNRAGGAAFIMVSQGTRNEGTFYDAFHSKSKFFKTLRISSEDSPNVRAGRIVIPGLAGLDWLQEKRDEWGENSPAYKIRVLGDFAEHEEGKIFSIHAITESEKRWSETPDTGRLFLGIDPSGESGSGDDAAFVARRGLKMIKMATYLGLTNDAYLVHILAWIKELRVPRETPVVVVDREGPIGSSLAGFLRDYAERNPSAFELVSVRASDKAVRQPMIYDRMRDELVANLETWFRDGGAILEDAKLLKELHAMQWKPGANGRLKLTPKTDLRKFLGRSPDRFDALALSVWEPLSLHADDLPESAKPMVNPQHQQHDDHEPTSSGMDPYAGAASWRK